MTGELKEKVLAIRESISLGCVGAHKSKSGQWLPCSSSNEFIHVVFAEEVKSRLTYDDMSSWSSRRVKKGKKKKKPKGWEKLTESPIVGIDTLAGGGLVSSAISTKSVSQQYTPRDNDVDVFVDIESARQRSRQLGCIGVSRRISKNGKTVWMPCTNMSDYAKLAGTTFLGRRHQAEAAKKIVRTVLKENIKKRKKSISEELYSKSIGRRIRNAAQFFDPNAIDGDNDGLIQEGSPFERPATPNKPTTPAVKPFSRNLTPVEVNKSSKWFNSLSSDEKENIMWPPVDAFEPKYNRSVRLGLASTNAKPAPKVIDNPNATPANPFNAVGGKAMGEIIRGRVKPEHKNKKERTFFLFGGTTGSGKSMVVEHLQKIGIIPKDDEAAHIDPDFIKMGIPGYRDGAGVGAVHQQSRTSTDYTIKDSAAEGMDLIVEGVGKRLEHPRDAKKRGESVVAHYVYAPVKTAESRMRERSQNTGRSLDTWLAGQIASEIPPAISRMFDENLLNEFYLWDNSGDITKGELPKIIASKIPGQKMQINDPEKFADFAGGSRWAKEWETKANSSDNTIS